MRITLILTGKTKEHYLQEGIEEYVKRLKHYIPFSVVVLPDPKLSGKEKRSKAGKSCRSSGPRTM